MAAPHFVLADTTGPATAVITSTDGLNLRSGPGTTFAVLAVMPANATVAVTGSPTADNWFPVQYQGQQGWADGTYLSLSASDPGPGAAIASAAPPGGPAAAGSASSSSAASSSAAAGGAASAPPPPPPAVGATAAATRAPASSPAPAGSTPTTATVLPSDGLNERTGPGTSYGVVTVIPGGATVTITGSAANGWVPVSFNGSSGWVDAAYIQQASSSSTITANTTSASPGASLGPSAGAGAPSPAGFTGVSFSSGAPSEAGLPIGIPPAGTVLHFIWPTDSRRVSTVFSSWHQAIDIDEFPSGGNQIHAIADGVVTYAGGTACCSYGLYVIVEHANGFTSLYSHFSSIAVSVGQVVTQGQPLGRSGCTGRCTGPHVHFAIYYNGNPLDPLTVLPSGAQIE